MRRDYFDDAMRRLGWIEGQNLTVERRVSGHEPRQRAEAIGQLIARSPELIVAGGTTDALPLRAATKSIPIVVIHGTDLVEAGLVESLGSPGTNVTGITVIGRELDGKRLELLRELIPAAERVSMIGHPAQRMTFPRMDALEELCRALGFRLVRRLAGQPEEMDTAFAAAAAAGDHAVLIPFNAVTFESRPRIAALASRLGMPAFYEFRDYVADGGLISYGAVYKDYLDRAAFIVDKILKGSAPAELPVERPTRFELALNLAAAKGLGLPVPGTIMARADELIE